ncbi:hypothetical protein BC834DRAFT_149593 [Gloeopeniophorella convolvens]|nr:hypothetical protein BC834DRAFT_149593 [Gloeopeniophorella convolvens]
MTEYTTDPDAIAHYLAARARTANWVDSLSGKALVAPSIPPSLVSDTDDGLSSQDSDAESSHSLPPRMILRYPDGRPDIPVSGQPQWHPPGQKPALPPYSGRPRAGSHGYTPSNPNIHSRAPSNAGPLYIPPPPPIMIHQPETIHVRPSPTSPSAQKSANSYLSANSHNSPVSSRSKSMRSAHSRPPPPPLQMIYTPPAPSSQSRSAPVSPIRASFQGAQQPPPVPIAAPSPVYGFSSPTPALELPPAGPPPQSRTQSYSSGQSHPHPPAAAAAPVGSSAPAPPASHVSGSTHRHRHHSSRGGISHASPQQASHADSQYSSQGGSSLASGSISRRHAPPSIVYAPSANSASYSYNPPVITSRPPPPVTHTPTPHHAHRLAQSISDPTPIGGSLGRTSNRGRLFEHLSRTPSPATARARAKESKKDKSRKDKSRDRRDEDEDDGASVSSGSTYYVLPSPGQKIKVVPPASLAGLYAAPTSGSASRSTPVLQSRPTHRIPNNPYLPTPSASQVSQTPQKRPLLQRIFHPQFSIGGGNTNTASEASSSRRTLRRNP